MATGPGRYDRRGISSVLRCSTRKFRDDATTERWTARTDGLVNQGLRSFAHFPSLEDALCYYPWRLLMTDYSRLAMLIGLRMTLAIHLALTAKEDQEMVVARNLLEALRPQLDDIYGRKLASEVQEAVEDLLDEAAECARAIVRIPASEMPLIDT